MSSFAAAALLDRAEATLGEALPRIGGAILVLMLGLAVAAVAGRLTARALRTLRVDDLAERYGVHDVTTRLGLERSLAALLGRAVRIALTIVVVLAAVALLGLGALEASLNAVVLFLPKLFVAAVLVIAGFVVADFVGDRVARVSDQMNLGAVPARLAQGIVIALFVLTAFAQLGVPTAILTSLVGLLMLAAALTLALAFGLGGRDVARQLSAGRYVGGTFEIGQRIAVAGVAGEIVALESASIMLRTDEGRTVRVPNNLLLESIVTVE